MARRCSSVKGLVALLLAALTLAACSAGDDSGVEGPVTVYVSLPLTGPFAGDGRDAADGARLALEQAGGRAGDLEVRATYLDDAAPGAAWDPVAVGANARRAAQDTSTAAYIGELSSQPTRASLPITNEAGIPQVSPGAGAIDLTGPAEGYPDSPDRYRPSGEVTFARVVPSDEALARGAAQKIAELGLTRASVRFDDRDPWATLVAERFEQEARADGLELIPPAPGRPGRGDAFVLVPGQDGPGGAVAQTLISVDSAELSFTIGEVQDARVLPSPLGRSFADAFRARFDRRPGPYAAYGYESMRAVTAAIEGRSDEADSFRAGVAKALLDLELPDSVLGSFAFTEEGDSTLCRLQVTDSPGSSAALCVRG